MSQCTSCGGFCKKSGCERENVPEKPKRQWVGLTAAEVFKALEANEQDYNWHGFARDLEAKLKEKNT